MSESTFCTYCGAEMPVERLACPACGSCSETGWADPGGGRALGLAQMPDMSSGEPGAVRSLRDYRTASLARKRRAILSLLVVAAGLFWILYVLLAS